MPGKRHPFGAQADVAGDLHVQQSQRDRDPAPAREHVGQVAVGGVVVVVDVAREAEFLEEIAVQRAQPVQDRSVGGEAVLEPQGQGVDVGQHGFDVEFGILVLRDGDGRLEQRELPVVRDQGREVLQDARDIEARRGGHESQFRSDAGGAGDPDEPASAGFPEARGAPTRD